MLSRFHKVYTIPSTIRITTKLAQQFVGPFRVIEKIGDLAYKLRIPPYWKIYPVFTIAQLRLYISGEIYEQKLPKQPLDLFTDCKVKKNLFVVDCLLNKQVMKKGKRLAME